MEVLVKICGLSDEATVDAALDAGADLIGLVTFAPSPRFVTPRIAAELAARVRGRAEVVLLTVDMAIADIAAFADVARPDWLQFHGQETPEFVASAKQRFGTRVMKVIGVSNATDLRLARRYVATADRLLLDAKPPKDATLPGGRGERFDWRILEGVDPGLPFMLSGGLNADNVAAALTITRAAGVDVSSGVETAPGRKDPDLIHAFVTAARDAARSLPAASAIDRVAS